ncbi:MAG: hypothetical protein HOE86_06640, partial [Gemmatimonadetes bacterium]|nr:hypothetical protein [Gemmatimonadota bacterium]
MISVLNKLVRYGRPGNRALLVIGVLCIHGGACESAAQFTSYAARTEFLLTPPGVHPGGLSGFVNPATLALLQAPEASATFASAGDRRAVRSDWGWFAALPHIGGGV